MAQPEIYLVRHGETEWNRIDRYQGQLDSPLTEAGQAQARAVGRRLAADLADPAELTFHCSPLGRCRATAALVAEEAGIDAASIIYDDRLMERRYGRWKGLAMDEISRRFPEDIDGLRREYWTYVIPGGGESMPALQARLGAWLAEQPDGAPLIAVSHGIAGKALRGLYLGLAPADTIALNEPQGAVMHLRDGRETILEGIF